MDEHDNVAIDTSTLPFTVYIFLSRVEGTKPRSSLYQVLSQHDEE